MFSHSFKIIGECECYIFRKNMTKITTIKDKSVDEIISAPCGICKRNNRQKVLSDIELSGVEETEDTFIYGWKDQYQIIQCQGCESTIFRKTPENSEDMDYCQGSDCWDADYKLFEDYYPNTEHSRSLIADYYILPDNLQRIYKETIVALNNNSPVLTAIGIRAIIETICKDKNTSGRDLNSRIDDLVVQGVLTTEGSTILHKLRGLGNEAAHEVKPHSNVQLGLAFDVIEHLLQGVYILPHHAKLTFD